MKSGKVRGRYVAATAALLVLVAGLAALHERYGPAGQGEDLLPSLSVHSSREGGGRALYLWLAELGYHPAALEYRPFALDASARALFVLSPGKNLTGDHSAEIVRWVEQGGTLVLASEEQNPLLDRLGLQVTSRDGRLAEAVPRQPVFLNPGLDRLEVDTPVALRLDRPEWVPILGGAEAESRPIAAAATLGRGRAFALAATHPFSNAGLSRAGNWKLPLHLLAAVPLGSTVLFDEYHHGLTEHGTLGARLLRESWGWAILYSGVLLFAYVALRGRRFGRALPAFQSGPRRSREEYVSTLAAMLRQGGHQEWLCRQFAGQTRRALGVRFRVRPDLPAGEFVAALAAQRPEAAALAPLLNRLEGKAPPPRNEAAAVALMREVDTLRERLLGR